MTRTDGLSFAPETIKKHRRDWIKAMRSGDYRRATTYLAKARGTDGVPVAFCCLGLACHIAKVPSVLSENRTYAGKHFLEYGADHDQGYLPREARDWLGVDAKDPGIEWPVTHRMYGITLAGLNDCGWTFEQIADALEKYGIRKMDDLLAVIE